MNQLRFEIPEAERAPAALLDLIKAQRRAPELFIRQPFEKELLEEIEHRFAKKPASVLLVGIGGSSLGALAAYQALRPAKKIYFAETFDARRLDRMLKKIKRPVGVAIVSKSGTTTETLANAAVILGRLKKSDQVVAVTDKGSKLWNWADENGVAVLPVPKDVVGRYSVFSAVGALPLHWAGISVDKLFKGARDITAACLSENIKENPAARSALTIHRWLNEGKTIHDTFVFEPDLEGVGRWYRQLTGESIGKQGKGMTPTVSVGTTDLHSVAQLYLDGPKDKLTTFISVRDHGKDFAIKSRQGIEDLVPDLAGRKFGALLDAVLEGVKRTYRKQNLPFMEIELAKVSEEAIGALLQMKMIEMMYLGKLMGVNPFDNPAIELYKEETRKLLQKL